VQSRQRGNVGSAGAGRGDVWPSDTKSKVL